MAKFVELTNNSGQKILVNLHEAVTIVPEHSNTNTLIYFPASKASVRETYEEIRALLFTPKF